MKYILSFVLIIFSTLSQANSSSIESYSYHHLRLGNTTEVFQFLKMVTVLHKTFLMPTLFLKSQLCLEMLRRIKL